MSTTDRGALAALDDAPSWLNSEPLTAAGLRGRVVLVDFWTYSCVNWLRTLPYIRAWSVKYGPEGFTVIGVHTDGDAPAYVISIDWDGDRVALIRDYRYVPYILDEASPVYT